MENVNCRAYELVVLSLLSTPVLHLQTNIGDNRILEVILTSAPYIVWTSNNYQCDGVAPNDALLYMLKAAICLASLHLKITE